VSSVRIEECRTLVAWRRPSSNLGGARETAATDAVLTSDADVGDIVASAR
jgi:hypothetical protein